VLPSADPGGPDGTGGSGPGRAGCPRAARNL